MSTSVEQTITVVLQYSRLFDPFLLGSVSHSYFFGSTCIYLVTTTQRGQNNTLPTWVLRAISTVASVVSDIQSYTIPTTLLLLSFSDTLSVYCVQHRPLCLLEQRLDSILCPVHFLTFKSFVITQDVETTRADSWVIYAQSNQIESNSSHWKCFQSHGLHHKSPAFGPVDHRRAHPEIRIITE